MSPNGGQLHAGAPSNAGPGPDLLHYMVEVVRDYAIFALDAGGNIASWNRGAERLKGYTADEIIGKHFSTFYLEEDRRRGHPEEELAIAKAEGRYEEDGWRVRKDGSRFWANVLITAVFDAEGRHIGFTKVTRDITERRAHEERLRLSEERFRLLVDSVHDYALYMLDPVGRVVSWNSGAERLKGNAAAEIIGQHFSTFYPEEARKTGRAAEELHIALERGHYEEEGWRVRKDGTSFWAHVVLTPIWDDAGVHIGFAKVTRDLSERRRLEAQREDMLARLERSNRELQDFAMVASHDIQEPLRKIQLFTNQLREEFEAQLPAEARDYLERMQRAANRGRTLVQGLLAFSRVTTRAQPAVATDLGDVVREVLQDLEVQIASAGARVDIGDLPTIDADPLQMRQVFQNLIGNAVKFRRPGVEPTVTISAARGAEAGPSAQTPCVRIAVADNGIGFDERYADRIFKLFQRLHERTSYEGSGIGLAVCRKIIERHGGSISAHSTPGVGTTFVLELPEHQ